jgi:hypothetical protein
MFSQTEQIAGSYVLNLGNKTDNLFEYELYLNNDGTFTFYYHSFIKTGIPQEKNFYGKGTWTVTNNVVLFSTDSQKDLDQKNTLDFTNSKARFVTKSPRDKTDKVVETKLHFLQTDIPFMSRIALPKR